MAAITGASVAAMMVTLLAQQTRDVPSARPSQTGAAIVTGRVVAADSGQPLRRVLMTLRDADTAVIGGRLAVTNDNGQFAFRGLPAGRFQLTATKPAYLPMAYGMKRPTRPGGAATGPAIVLADGQQMTVDFKLTRGGVVAGTVRDGAGQPANGTRVTALAYIRAGITGERSLATIGVATSDDRGSYRIFGLSPGEFLIAVTNTSIPAGDLSVLAAADLKRADDLLPAGPAATTAPAPPRPKTVGFVPVYHPGTSVASDATFVTLGPGEEKTDIDVRLEYVPTARVTGTLMYSDGKPATGVTVRAFGKLSPSVGLIAPGGSSPTDAEGRFVLHGIAPGAYVIAVRAPIPGRPPGPVPLWAQADITVSGEDQVVNLTLQEGSNISGRIAFVGAQSPPDAARFTVGLTADQSSGMVFGAFGALQSEADTSGRFAIAGVAPGRYRLWIAGQRVPGWFIRSGTVGGVDALDAAFELRANQDITDAMIAMTDRETELSGRLIDGNGAPVPDFTVIMFPADPALWTAGQARRIQGMRPAQDGRFTFRNLAPGDYLLGAADDVEVGDWLEPAFLRTLVANGTVKVTVSEGEKKVTDLRVR